MTNTETDRVKRLRDLAEHWHGHEASGFFAGCADEIERLQLRESQARAILEPLAEHDPAIRQWLKGLPVDTQVERMRVALTWLRSWRTKDPESVDHTIEQALSGDPSSPHEPKDDVLTPDDIHEKCGHRYGAHRYAGNGLVCPRVRTTAQHSSET